MTTEERARKWLQATWPWSLDADGPSDREVRLLSAEFDAVAAEQWAHDQNNHHAGGETGMTVTCQVCIANEREAQADKALIRKLMDICSDCPPDVTEVGCATCNGSGVVAKRKR